MWVRKQYMNALFTKDRSKVTATVHVPYMNSAACWGKGLKKIKNKKRRKLKTQQTQRGSKLSLYCLSDKQVESCHNQNYVILGQKLKHITLI